MTSRSRRPLLLLVAPLAIHVGARPLQTVPPRPLAVPYRADGIYGIGEKVGWTVSSPEGVVLGKVPYTLKTDNHERVRSGEIDLSSGAVRIEAVLASPAMLTLTFGSLPNGQPDAHGAAIAPRRLAPVTPKPDDFDAFWKGQLARLAKVPENPVLTPGESDRSSVEYATIRMDHVNGTHVYGQIAHPKARGRYPAIIQFQWASPPYPLQKPWVTGYAAQGFLALNIEPHDVLPTEPNAYYQALPTAIKNYASIGQDDRDRSYFVEMALRDVRAVEYLAHRPDWDGKTLIVIGTSMGGQQSFYAAGLDPKVTHLIVDEPAGCDLNAGLHGRQEGYPFFPVDDPKVMETARYVDPVNFASRIRATSLVAMGFVDNIAPPAGIWTAFNRIRGPKEAAPMVDSPHNNYATPEQQRPYSQRASEWLDALAKTGKVEPRIAVGKP